MSTIQKRLLKDSAATLTRPLVQLSAVLLIATACSSAGAPTPGNVSTQLQGATDPVDEIVRMRVPGLIVSRTADGGIALQISGPPASMDGDNVPLYLIDESPFTPVPNGALTGIDPALIASVRVLRRAEASIYGLRGANGVILITTKRAGPSKH